MLAAAAVGAAVDQTAARVLEDRWLQFIRDCGSDEPPSGWTYLGGDVTDCYYSAGADDLVWIGADWFAGTTIGDDDTYNGAALPYRNGAVIETAIGTFEGAVQLHRSGNTGIWLDAVEDGDLPEGTIWWPIAGFQEDGTNRILCWHVDSSSPTPWGTLLDSHIVTLTGFGTYDSHVECGFGAVTDGFWVDGVLPDATYTYVYGEQFVPDYDANTGGGQPNYGQGGLRSHFTMKRVARVPAGEITDVDAWEFWNGGGWVSGVQHATAMVDHEGRPVAGDAGVAKVADGHYLLAAHRLADTCLNVYQSSVPQGPWELIARVPLPTQGATINGGVQVGQLTKILPTQAHPEGMPAEHRLVMLSRNLLHPTAPMTAHNIRRYAPQFAVVPIYGAT